MNQLFLFLPLVVFGFVMGIFYHILKIFKAKTTCRPIPYILDAIFVLAVGVGFVGLTLALCSGAFHFFMLAGLSVGLILFNMLCTIISDKFESQKN